MLEYVPLAVAIAGLAAVAAAPASGRIDTQLSRAAFRIFGGREVERDPERERLLRAAAIGTPYREYVVKTRLYLAVGTVAGGVVGAYAGRGLLGVVRTAAGGESAAEWAATLAFDGAETVFPLGGAVAVAALGVGSVHAVRWRLPGVRADSRRREIEAGLPRTVAFTYALARGGMSFPDVLRTIARNDDVFGESAAAVGIAVRNIDFFDVDLVTAVQRLSEETPSEGFGTFTENLSSVLRSGGNVSEFLRGQYERYRDEAEDRQAEMLNLLATTAEVYVTLIVAGMLFLVTILLIIGLTAGNTLRILRVLTYVVIPAANLLFLAYLLDITRPIRLGGGSRVREGAAETSAALPDGGGGVDGYARPGSAANHGRFLAYRRLRSVRETLASPLASVLERPRLLLYVTVPIAVIATAIRAPAALAGGVDLRALDDLLVQATIFLTGTFAVVYEYRKLRLRRLEAATPDLLERLASLNEAGISVVSSFDRVRRSDIGALDEEVDRIWRDMKWGATAAAALERFESRVRTPSITRVVTLITNAMRASNEIGPVLRIAAEQARSDLQLRRRRRQEMFTYLVVVYVSFLVFLIVIGALEYVLIPSLPDVGALSEGAAGGSGLAAGFEAGDRDAYRLVFFHTALVQSALSGLVAGVMGGGSIGDGMKHTAAMLSITYVALALLA